ncbi:MAG: cysteine--tRNA ligase, partial [Anaerolineae bacterium]|nr:cysteine--tRNA ligase [Anaerolineae bacterium]
DLLRQLSGILGLQLERVDNRSAEAAPFIELLIEMRTEMRKEKLWAFSDLVRDRLAELGVLIEDNKDGTSWRWK